MSDVQNVVEFSSHKLYGLNRRTYVVMSNFNSTTETKSYKRNCYQIY